MSFLNKNILKAITSDHIITTKIIDAETDFNYTLNSFDYITSMVFLINVMELQYLSKIIQQLF